MFIWDWKNLHGKAFFNVLSDLSSELGIPRWSSNWNPEQEVSIMQNEFSWDEFKRISMEYSQVLRKSFTHNERHKTFHWESSDNFSHNTFWRNAFNLSCQIRLWWIFNLDQRYQVTILRKVTISSWSVKFRRIRESRNFHGYTM